MQFTIADILSLFNSALLPDNPHVAIIMNSLSITTIFFETIHAKSAISADAANIVIAHNGYIPCRNTNPCNRRMNTTLNPMLVNNAFLNMMPNNPLIFSHTLFEQSLAIIPQPKFNGPVDNIVRGIYRNIIHIIESFINGRNAISFSSMTYTIYIILMLAYRYNYMFVVQFVNRIIHYTQTKQYRQINIEVAGFVQVIHEQINKTWLNSATKIFEAMWNTLFASPRTLMQISFNHQVVLDMLDNIFIIPIQILAACVYAIINNMQRDLYIINHM